MDFTGLSGSPAMTIPTFKSMQEAREWAHQKKWNDILIKSLEDEISYLDFKTQERLQSVANLELAIETIEQIDFLNTVYEIIQEYKNKKMTAPKDQAMTSEEFYSNYTIPIFQNIQEATIWAHKTQWKEPIRRKLKDKITELLNIVSPYANSLEPVHLKMKSYYMSQKEDCEAALKIIEQYKSISKNDDSAMTQEEFYNKYKYYRIPKFKDTADAVLWAHKQKWNEELMLRIANRISNFHIEAIQNLKSNIKGSNERAQNAIAQWEASKIALSIMEDYKKSGTKSDEAMSKKDVPRFTSTNEASQWAHEVKWNEEFMKVLKRRMLRIEITSLQSIRQPHTDDSLLGNEKIDQYEAYSLALAIMKDYRDKGEKGDSAMGSTFYAGSVPVR